MGAGEATGTCFHFEVLDGWPDCTLRLDSSSLPPCILIEKGMRPSPVGWETQDRILPLF